MSLPNSSTCAAFSASQPIRRDLVILPDGTPFPPFSMVSLFGLINPRLPAKITVVEQKLNRFCVLAEQESLSKYSKTSKTKSLTQIGAWLAGWKRQQIV